MSGSFNRIRYSSENTDSNRASFLIKTNFSVPSFNTIVAAQKMLMTTEHATAAARER
eukprot:COSAG02_NODE_577_length_20095_cov_6.816413_23_plen_57_part_00